MVLSFFFVFLRLILMYAISYQKWSVATLQGPLCMQDAAQFLVPSPCYTLISFSDSQSWANLFYPLSCSIFSLFSSKLATKTHCVLKHEETPSRRLSRVSLVACLAWAHEILAHHRATPRSRALSLASVPLRAISETALCDFDVASGKGRFARQWPLTRVEIHAARHPKYK